MGRFYDKQVSFRFWSVLKRCGVDSGDTKKENLMVE